MRNENKNTFKIMPEPSKPKATGITRFRQNMGAIGTPLMFGAFLQYGEPVMLAGSVAALYMLFHVEVNGKIKEFLKM